MPEKSLFPDCHPPPFLHQSLQWAVQVTCITKGLHGPYKGLFLAKPKGFRILFLLHLRPAADFLSAVLYNLFCLSETFLRFTFPFVLYFYLHTYPQENPHSLTLYLDSFLSPAAQSFWSHGYSLWFSFLQKGTGPPRRTAPILYGKTRFSV